MDKVKQEDEKIFKVLKTEDMENKLEETFRRNFADSYYAY